MAETKSPEQSLRDREWGMDLRKRALGAWREVSGAGVCETEPRYSHVDGLAVPIQPNDRPYFLEVQARRCPVGRFKTLLFGGQQYRAILDYHRDLGFPTLLLSVWSDGMGHLMIPSPKGDPLVSREGEGVGEKVYLNVNLFDWIRPDVFRKWFPPDLFT